MKESVDILVISMYSAYFKKNKMIKHHNEVITQKLDYIRFCGYCLKWTLTSLGFWLWKFWADNLVMHTLDFSIMGNRLLRTLRID